MIPRTRRFPMRPILTPLPLKRRTPPLTPEQRAELRAATDVFFGSRSKRPRFDLDALLDSGSSGSSARVDRAIFLHMDTEKTQ